MTLPVIIITCILLLLAFVFELIAKRIKSPSVILMLLLGWSASQLVAVMNIPFPRIDPVLPILGTVGLILIVLEGAMELELSKEKSGLIKKSFFISLFSHSHYRFFTCLCFLSIGPGFI